MSTANKSIFLQGLFALFLFLSSSLYGATTLYTKKIYTANNVLIIETSTKVNEKSVKSFTLPPSEGIKEFRTIVDFEGQLSLSSAKPMLEGISAIKIAQFTPKTVRIVFYSSQRLPVVKIDLKESKLSVEFEGLSTKKENHDEVNDVPPLPFSLVVAEKAKKIVLDAGHGGKDSGAVGYQGLMEKHVVLSIAQKVAFLLGKKGYDVILTRNDDTFVELTERTALANRAGADIFVSIHANAVGNGNTEVKGLETYFLSPAKTDRAKKAAMKENAMGVGIMDSTFQSLFLTVMNKEKIIASNKLGIDIQKGLLGSVVGRYNGIVDNGVREGPFWVLVGASMPAVLVEVGYVTNPTEATRLGTEEYQELLANGIAQGCERYFQKN